MDYKSGDILVIRQNETIDHRIVVLFVNKKDIFYCFEKDTKIIKSTSKIFNCLISRKQDTSDQFLKKSKLVNNINEKFVFLLIYKISKSHLKKIDNIEKITPKKNIINDYGKLRRDDIHMKYKDLKFEWIFIPKYIFSNSKKQPLLEMNYYSAYRYLGKHDQNGLYVVGKNKYNVYLPIKLCLNYFKFYNLCIGTNDKNTFNEIELVFNDKVKNYILPGCTFTYREEKFTCMYNGLNNLHLSNNTFILKTIFKQELSYTINKNNAFLLCFKQKETEKILDMKNFLFNSVRSIDFFNELKNIDIDDQFLSFDENVIDVTELNNMLISKNECSNTILELLNEMENLDLNTNFYCPFFVKENDYNFQIYEIVKIFPSKYFYLITNCVNKQKRKSNNNNNEEDDMFIGSGYERVGMILYSCQLYDENTIKFNTYDDAYEWSMERKQQRDGLINKLNIFNTIEWYDHKREEKLQSKLLFDYFNHKNVVHYQAINNERDYENFFNNEALKTQHLSVKKEQIISIKKNLNVQEYTFFENNNTFDSLSKKIKSQRSIRSDNEKPNILNLKNGNNREVIEDDLLYWTSLKYGNEQDFFVGEYINMNDSKRTFKKNKYVSFHFPGIINIISKIVYITDDNDLIIDFYNSWVTNKPLYNNYCNTKYFYDNSNIRLMRLNNYKYIDCHDTLQDAMDKNLQFIKKKFQKMNIRKYKRLF